MHELCRTLSAKYLAIRNGTGDMDEQNRHSASNVTIRTGRSPKSDDTYIKTTSASHHSDLEHNNGHTYHLVVLLYSVSTAGPTRLNTDVFRGTVVNAYLGRKTLPQEFSIAEIWSRL
jgi:hypothetical protein